MIVLGELERKRFAVSAGGLQTDCTRLTLSFNNQALNSA